MNSILQAFEEGYGEDEILSFLSKAIPKLGSTIKKASKSGYGAREILGFLSKNFDTESTKGKSESQIHGINQRADAERTKYGLKLAGTAIATPLAAHAARGALSRALPSSLQGLAGQSPQTNNQSIQNAPNISMPTSEQTLQPIPGKPQEQNILQPENPSQQPPISKVESNIPQPTETVQPKGISDKLWKSVEDGKLTDKDPNISAFLKVANSLRKTRGLSTKEQFDNLYKVFENKREMGLEGPALARELFAEWDQMKDENGQNSQIQQQMGKNLESPSKKLDEAKEIERPKNKLNLPFSENSYRKLLSAEPSSLVGKLKDFIEDDKIKKIFDPVLDIDIALAPKGHYKSNGAKGSYVSKDYGKVILLDPEEVMFGDPKDIYTTILHEATHALQDHKGRIDYLKKGDYYKGKVGVDEEANKQYQENIHEKSARKLAEYGSNRHIEKKDIVASPNGVGEVKEIRNGKALIDVDGKMHKVDEDELISSPLPEKDLSELYDDLIKGVESETGEDVSRMVDWAGYDPNTGKLAFLPHDGGLYTYSNLSQEEVDQLTDILSTRKSSGSNFIGAWKAGSKSPIGAAMSALIKKLQSERGGKGNEYLEKFETVYKALEPAIKAAKKKKKK